MEITDVRIKKITGEGKLKAIVSITLDSVFVVHDIKIIDGEMGMFIAMPSKRTLEGEYRDVVHPIQTATRTSFQETILDAYKRILEQEEAMEAAGENFY